MLQLSFLASTFTGLGLSRGPFSSSPAAFGSSHSWHRARAEVLGGSWDLATRGRSTLIGVISRYSYNDRTYNPTY